MFSNELDFVFTLAFRLVCFPIFIKPLLKHDYSYGISNHMCAHGNYFTILIVPESCQAQGNNLSAEPLCGTS